jgi:hypothetical protein
VLAFLRPFEVPLPEGLDSGALPALSSEIQQVTNPALDIGILSAAGNAGDLCPLL